MNRSRVICILLFILLSIPSVVLARDIAPFVSTDWLEKNLSLPGLVVIDARTAVEYQKSHIPNSINSWNGQWAVTQNGLLRKLPADSVLQNLIASLGIKENSKIVITGKGETDFDRADAIQMGWALLASGVKNVSILDGGFVQWLKEKRATSSEPTKPVAGSYQAKIDRSKIVSKKYVQSSIGKIPLIDTRSPELFFGMTTEFYALKPGHIKSAVNLPAPWLFKDGLLRNIQELEAMAKGVVGDKKSKEVIVYCGVGAYASVMHYVLTELLGYTNVKLYDGSMQEWEMDPVGPITIFSWH
jgi:thiosulfate/3-mercaptopyruvate sulfurtransferase